MNVQVNYQINYNLVSDKQLKLVCHLFITAGAHTIGIGHCANVVSRLYPKRDPTLPLSFYMELRMLCPATPPRPSKVFQNLTGIVPTDLTNLWFDNQYFRDVQDGRGLFKVDANLVSDPRTRRVVQQFASSEEKFFAVFASAYFKMVTAKVLTGDSGNVRVDCTRPGEATTSVIN
jgi:peroxidase